MYLFAGYACCSPLSISILEYIIHDNLISQLDLCISIGLFTIGFLTATRAYSIMYEKDDQHVRD
jgi:hypothetical protein